MTGNSVSGSNFTPLKKCKHKTDKGRVVFTVVMIIVPIVHFLFFTVYVNLNTVILSFQTRNAAGDYVLNANPFQNYIDFFRSATKPYSTFKYAIANSLMYFLLNDVVIVPASVLLTYFLYKKIFMHKVFRVIFYFPCMISMVVLIMLYRFMFDSTFGVINPFLKSIGLGHLIPKFGWFGTRETANGVIIGYCIWSGLGGSFILLASAMGRIPEDIVEAGKIDGVGFFRELWSITIPLIGSTLATLFMMGTTVIFTFFLQVKLITNGQPNGETSTIMLFIVESVQSDTRDLSGAATVGMLVALVGTPLVLLTRKIVDKVFPTYEI